MLDVRTTNNARGSFEVMRMGAAQAMEDLFCICPSLKSRLDKGRIGQGDTLFVPEKFEPMREQVLGSLRLLDVAKKDLSSGLVAPSNTKTAQHLIQGLDGALNHALEELFSQEPYFEDPQNESAAEHESLGA